MSAFAGIDYDTRAVHVVLVPENLHEQCLYKRFPLEGHDAFDRARAVRDALPARGWWTDEGIIAVGIEEPFARGKLTIQNQPKLKAIQGAILSCLPRELLVNPMGASTWRKTAGVKGNASKAEVEFFVRYIGPHATSGFFEEDCLWPQDAFDAYCLALSVQKLTVEA